MANPVIQTSFNAGEWAPSLYARVDLTKYHSGAALLRNFFVDYRGGATTRNGTKYILQTRSTNTVRLFPFQASFTVTYVLEFGTGYIRFFNNGAPVLENSTTISAINIGTSTITDTAHGYANGDWIFISGITGTVGNQLNGNYYIVAGAATNTFTLTDLNGVAITLTGAYTAGGTAQRVYTLGPNAIASGTYTSATGAVSLTLSASANIGVGAQITVSGLTGTGGFASLNGIYTTTAGTTGTTVNYTAASGLGVSTITGGALTNVDRKSVV